MARSGVRGFLSPLTLGGGVPGPRGAGSPGPEELVWLELLRPKLQWPLRWGGGQGGRGPGTYPPRPHSGWVEPAAPAPNPRLGSLAVRAWGPPSWVPPWKVGSPLGGGRSWGLVAEVESQAGRPSRSPPHDFGGLSVFQGPSMGWEGAPSETDLPGPTGRRTLAQARAGG